MKTSWNRYVSLLGYRQGRWLTTPLTVSDPSFSKVADPWWDGFEGRYRRRRFEDAVNLSGT